MFAARWLRPLNRTDHVRTETWLPAAGIAATVDWRTHGAVTPVKNRKRWIPLVCVPAQQYIPADTNPTATHPGQTP